MHAQRRLKFFEFAVYLKIPRTDLSLAELYRAGADVYNLRLASFSVHFEIARAGDTGR